MLRFHYTLVSSCQGSVRHSIAFGVHWNVRCFSQQDVVCAFISAVSSLHGQRKIRILWLTLAEGLKCSSWLQAYPGLVAVVVVVESSLVVVAAAGAGGGGGGGVVVVVATSSTQ